jgi:hypothetical protein
VTRRRGVSKQRRFFSFISSLLIILSTLLVGVSIQIPNASAGAVSMDVSNLEVNMLTDYGRVLYALQWGTLQTVQDPTFGLGFIGLVIDHDNYDHTSGAEDIADSFDMYPYINMDDFEIVKDITLVIDTLTEQKSIGSFQNKGLGTGFPDDILINQTAWSYMNKDWVILQWNLINVKSPASALTNVSIGLEVPISKEGARYGLGGSLVDSGDDVDGYDGTEDVYWAQDTSDGTTIGFASAIVSDPITHYFADDYQAEYENTSLPGDPDPKYYKNFFGNDTWLYQRLSAPNSTATDSVTPKNITATVGWDGFDILAGESRTVTLVIAINGTYNDMITAIKEARIYYHVVASGFKITEFSDSSSAIQRIEVFNFGGKATDLVSEGYFLSIDGGVTPLSGNWNKNPIPTNDYGVFTITVGNIGPEGDTIGLYQDLGGGNIILIDQISFGQKGKAPDPLSDESTARRYDTATFSYTNDWIRNASTGPSWGAQNDVGSVVSSPQVILNEVMFNPQAPGLGFIELIYLGGGTLDIQGYRIISDIVYTIPIGSVLSPSNKYFLFMQSDDPVFFGQMDASSDNVYLYDNNGQLLDMVGWSSLHLQGMSVSRVPDGNGIYQGYNDASSEAAGWVFNRTLEVFITEISDNDSTVAQIEVYNTWYPTIDFSTGFTFKSDSGPLSGVWSIPIAPSDGYALFDITTPNGLNPEGDTIGFFQNGVLIEGISYGQKGVVPDPLPNESVQRVMVSGNYTNDWSRSWIAGPNFGFQNDVPPINSSSLVVLNEVMFNPGAPGYGYIELIYIGVTTLDVQGYSIICDSVYTIPAGNVLDTTDRYFILLQPDDPTFFSQLDASGDNVYLYDDNDQLLDMVGWNSSHNVNKSVARVPEGFGGRQGYDDTTSQLEGWVFDQNPTLHLINIGPYQFQIGIQGMTLSYNLNVSNDNNCDDVIDIGYFSVMGWVVQLLQSDGVTPLNDTETGAAMDGIPDTGIVGPNSSVQIVVNISIPFGIPGGVSEFTTIFANSSVNPMATDSALLNSSTLMGLEYKNPNRYVTFVRGTLMVIGHVDSTQVTVTDVSNGNLLNQFTVNAGESWTTSLFDAHVDINATHNVTVLTGESVYTSGGNSWMSYLPTEGGNKYGTFFYGFIAAEMFIFVPRLNPLPPTFITINDISDGDDTITLTNVNADFVNADVEIYKKTGFDDDIVMVTSNVQISILAGKVSNGVDWTATPPSVTGNELGKRFFLFASDSLTIFPLEDNTNVSVMDLSDGDDSKSLTMNRYDIYTQRTLSEFGNPIVARPGIMVYDNADNLIDDDYIEIIADKDILVYIGPICDQRQEFADLSPSVSTGIFSQEVFTYAQNGGANDLQIFVYDKEHTVVKVTSLTYSWGPGSGRDSLFDFTLDADDFSGVGPWWWEWGGWGGNILHIQSNLPTSVFNGDFDGPSFGSFLSVIEPPKNLLYPDLVITSADIAFEPGSIITNGSSVKIHATIHNMGDLDVTDIKVSFYDGNPSQGGALIASNLTIPFLMIGEDLTVNITWLPLNPGIYSIYVAVDYPTPGAVFEFDETNNIASKIMEIVPRLPPKLYIEANGDNIILNWTHAITSDLSHYLIYRSISQIEFNFFSPWVDTSNVSTNGIDPIDKQVVPLRTTWNDTGAASDLSPLEYYYVIIAVFKTGETSHTSRTVGKYTRIFPAGISTFSLPLEPLQIMWTDNYTTDMNADYIKYMDIGTHKWVQHDFGTGNINNTPMEMGKGFVVEFTVDTKYTFTGMPGAMIIYHNISFGFDATVGTGDASLFRATVNRTSNTINLNWTQPANLGSGDRYLILRSNSRDGFWGIFDVDYERINILPFDVLSYQDIGVATAGTQYYYMIMPVNLSNGQIGVSTYSIGVWTVSYYSQYDTIALPLKPSDYRTADWFCDNIDNTVGINYFNISAKRWEWHSTRMPEGAFDKLIELCFGYQISTTSATRFSYVGI